MQRGDFHQIIKYSAPGFCLDENVTRRKVQKNSQTGTRAHELEKVKIYLRCFFFQTSTE